MTYGGKELAASFRTVRSNTIRLRKTFLKAYDFRRPTRGRSQTLAHIAAVRVAHSRARIDDLANFPELMQKPAPRKPGRARGEIVAFLIRGRRSRLPRSLPRVLAETSDAAGLSRKSRFEMCSLRHEMHHRGQLMMLQRIRRPHLTQMRRDRLRTATAGRFVPARARGTIAASGSIAPRRYEAHPSADPPSSSAGGIRDRPKTSMYRIYRDIRFSENKAPYKTHVAANFPTRGLPKHEGAGLYFHVAADEVWVGGGMYAPPAPQLHAVREHIAGHARRLRTLVESPAFRREVGTLEGERLTARAARFLEGSSGRGVSEVPTVSRRPRIRAGLRHQPEVLRRPARRLPRLVPLLRFLNEPLLRSQRMTP